MNVSLGITLASLLIAAIADRFWIRTWFLSNLCAILAVIATVQCFIRKLWKFTIEQDQIRTEMLFTHHIDLRTPFEKISSISVFEGILEAFMDVGTIEFSTASSQLDHSSIKWSHVRSPRLIAAQLEELAKVRREKRGGPG